MIVLYLTFGHNLRVHQQAVFSAMTLLAQVAKGAGPQVEAVVYTDAPQYYRLLGDRARIITTTPEQLTSWRGPHDFFWRIKIKALQALTVQYPGENLLYLDADTFCFGKPGTLTDVLTQGTHLMHAREGALHELPTSTERTMYRQCSGNTFAGIVVDGNSTMYNAGVVGLAATRAGEAVTLALEVCDAMCAAGVTRRLVEQFALSLALEACGGLTAANGSIGHYWGNKEDWNERITAFFLEHHLGDDDLAQQIAAAGAVDFAALPIYKRSSGTRRKLRAWVDRTFDKRLHAYIPRPEEPANDLSERRLARRV